MSFRIDSFSIVRTYLNATSNNHIAVPLRYNGQMSHAFSKTFFVFGPVFSNCPFRLSTQRFYKHTLTKSDRGAYAVIGKNIRQEIHEKTRLNGDGSYLYGLKPVDFTIPPRICFSPPPPPKKPGVKNYMFPISLIVTGGTFTYFYMNNKNDAYDYWSAMQTGGIMPMFGKDEDEEK